MQHLSPPQLAQRLAIEGEEGPFLLDVREPWEFETCRIPGSTLIPMRTVPERIEELDCNKTIICICHHGGRSMQVANFLETRGFTKVINLTGGIHAWSLQVDPSVPTY